ncbi:MAG: TPM domain-containing protein, partial [Schleiferilactobacillus harbinensis]|nr:TPM domain-containing protein [Schleiferilactobacillus harbinensis]
MGKKSGCWRSLLGLFFFITIGLVFIHPAQVDAAIYVQDNAEVLDDDTIDYINDITNNQLAKLNGQPQYAVITESYIPSMSTINSQAASLFNKWGIGHAGWDNGILLLVAVENREYRLEVGYGLESVITDSTQDEIVTPEIVTKMRAGDYDWAIRDISDHVATILEHAKLDTPAIVIQRRQEQKYARIKRWLTIIGVILLAIGYYFARNYWLYRHIMRLTKNRYSYTLQPTFQTPLLTKVWHHAKIRPWVADAAVYWYVDHEVATYFLRLRASSALRKRMVTKTLGPTQNYLKIFKSIVAEMDLSPFMPKFRKQDVLTAVQHQLDQLVPQWQRNKEIVDQAAAQYLRDHPKAHADLAMIEQKVD